jgi:recombination protein RecA
MRPVAETGIKPLDNAIRGGLPVGAISELIGPECSGRTSIALSFLAQITLIGKVCAWVDVSNSFDPATAAAAGKNLARLLWVRCGVSHPDPVRAHRDFVYLTDTLCLPRLKEGCTAGASGRILAMR